VLTALSLGLLYILARPLVFVFFSVLVGLPEWWMSLFSSERSALVTRTGVSEAAAVPLLTGLLRMYLAPAVQSPNTSAI